MDNWLQKRLTPPKAQEARWTEFATALEKVWEEFFDPRLSRLERMRSSYTADDQDLVLKIREMGDYFSFELPKEADRPVALAWRRLEIEYKDMELILRSIFRRHFGDFPVEWYPLFAPSDQPYGYEFITSDYLLEPAYTKNIPPEGYFLTSRGIVGVDKLGLFRDHLDKERFRTEARPLVKRAKPLHIVFDGFLWFICYNMGLFNPEFNTGWLAENSYTLQFTLAGARFDYTSADVRRLDIDIFQVNSETDRVLEFPFYIPENYKRRLDNFLVDGFGDFLPLDILITNAPFDLPYREIQNNIPVIFEYNLLNNSQKIDSSDFEFAEFSLTEHRLEDRAYALPFSQAGNYALDQFLLDGFGDFIPLDLLRKSASDLPALTLIYAENIKQPPVNFEAVTNSNESKNRRVMAQCPAFITDFHKISQNKTDMSAFFIDEKPLDIVPFFDEIPADFAPLDYPYGGFA